MKKIWSSLLTLILALTLLNTNISNASGISYHMHTVQAGETLWTISQKYNMNLNRIQSLNHQNPHQLQVGDLVAVNTLKSIQVTVNDQIINFDRQPYIEKDRVFVPLRFIAEALNVDSIDWIQGSSTARIIKGDRTIEVMRGSDIARINGVQVKLDAPVQLYVDRTFVPLRFFSEAFGIENIQWDSQSYTARINYSDALTTTYAPVQALKSYSEDELLWLSRIVHAEAEGEPYAGKLAVANVIINRKNSHEFPNTIWGVIFDNNFGIQFTPVANGKIYNAPNADSVRAAREALEGNNNIGKSLYFLNPAKATNSWIIYNRIFHMRIGAHAFYL